MITLALVGVGTLGTRQFALWQHASVRIIAIDRDIVNAHNIGRQLFFTNEHIGMPKVHALPKRPHLDRVAEEITADNVAMCKADVIIDCTDNLATRLIVSAYAYHHNIPFIYGGAQGTTGMCGMFCKQTCAFDMLFGTKVDGEDCTQNTIDLAVADVVAQQQFVLAQQALEKQYISHLFVCTHNGCREGPLFPTDVREQQRTNATHVPARLCAGTFQVWIDQDCAQRLLGHHLFARNGVCTIFSNGRVLVRTDTAAQAKQLVTTLC